MAHKWGYLKKFEDENDIEHVSFSNYLEYHSKNAQNKMLKMLEAEERRNNFSIEHGFASEQTEKTRKALIIMRTTIETMRIW